MSPQPRRVFVRAHWRDLPERKPKPVAAPAVGRVGDGIASSPFRALIFFVCAAAVVGFVLYSTGNHHAAAKTHSAAAVSAAGASASPDSTTSASQAAVGTPEAATVGKRQAAAALAGVPAYSRQYDLRVRSSASMEAGQVAAYPYNTTLSVACYTTGPVVYGISGSDGYWDRVTGPDGITGYAADGWVMTTADVTTLVPAC